MQLRLLAGIAELLVEQVPGEVEQDASSGACRQMLDRQIDALADDALVLGDRTGRPGRASAPAPSRGRTCAVSRSFGQFDPVAFDAREA